MILLKKKLGQHFLNDKNIINKIIKYVNPSCHDHFVEIGPGDGAITMPLSEKVKHLTIVEKDKRLIPMLTNKLLKNRPVKIINEDVLKCNFQQKIRNNVRVIGNLPYNISTEIIFKILEISKRIKDIHFMMQKEVVSRMVAKPGSKEYGRLSIMTQVYFNVKKLFDIPPTVFYPQPKVMSSYVYLSPKSLSFENKTHEKKFKQIVTAAFMGRRKMIKSSLRELVKESDLIKLNINTNQRPEKMTIQNFLMISNIL